MIDGGVRMTNWYVVFVRGTYEHKVCEYLNGVEGLSAFVPQKEILYRKAGLVEKKIRLLFPGYVFVETEMEYTDFHNLIYSLRNKCSGIIRNLEYDREGTSALYDSEREMIERLVNSKKVVEHSVGFIEGDQIFITEGPLQGFESSIVHIDRHKRLATLEIDILGSKRSVKVSLEIVSKVV